jgi:fucose 4-O-acetylase-like acetyltransferase
MNIEIKNTHYPYVDFASGIMILWMILFHAIAHVWTVYPCIKFPYLHFFMPWFFYKSGMFFKERSISDLWHKDIRKLIRPFITWSIVGAFCFMTILLLNDNFSFHSFMTSIFHEAYFFGKIPMNTPLW